MTEITEQDKQHIIELREWIKAHPEFQNILHEQVPARLLMMRAKFATFHLPIATLLKIVEYGNEEFIMGYYLASKPKQEAK